MVFGLCLENLFPNEKKKEVCFTKGNQRVNI